MKGSELIHRGSGGIEESIVNREISCRAKINVITKQLSLFKKNNYPTL
jgi:hypothetical protein